MSSAGALPADSAVAPEHYDVLIIGAGILEYLEGAIEDDHIDAHIRYQHEVRSAAWSSEGYTPDFPGMADFQGRIVHPTSS